jgi:hypothetical protein
MKPVIMLPEQWEPVWEEIKKREKPSTFLSRTKMREVLGFTVRTHEEWVEEDDVPESYIETYNDIFGTDTFKRPTRYERTVRLDFYDEQKRLMFLLKYGPGK